MGGIIAIILGIVAIIYGIAEKMSAKNQLMEAFGEGSSKPTIFIVVGAILLVVGIVMVKKGKTKA